MKYRLVLLTFLIGYLNIQAQPLQVKRIKDISAGSNDASQPYGFFEFNHKLYFGAGDNVHGSELWVSDGTESGTHIVVDLDPGIYSYYPKSFANFNGKLYFNTYSNNYLDKGNIWFTDGTANGTVWVDSLYIFESIVNTGNMLLCIGTHDPYPFFKGGIYKITTTNPSAQLVDTVLGNGMKAIGTYAVFIKPNPWNHQQLWVTDGTKAGTKLLKDIDVNGPPATLNTRFSNPFTAWGNKLLFSAKDGTNRNKLWVTDGTDTGTHILIDALPGASSLSPTYMTICNGKIFFAGTNDNGETSLWVSDGTNAGTKSISSPMGLSENRMASFAAFNNKIYFNDFNSAGIWESDGTITGTHLFADSIGYAGKYMVTNGYLYFFGREISGTYLYRIDSQSNLVKALTPLQSKIIDPDYEMGTLNNKLIFCGAPAGSNDYELWGVDDFPADVKNIGYKNEKIIYPNPATNAFSIQAVNNTNAVVKVFSLTGQLMLQTKSTENINIAHLPAGVYMVQVTGDGNTHTGKLVKE